MTEVTIKGVIRKDGEHEIYVNGHKAFHVKKHSPTGMSWGFGGSGPADCAYTICLLLLTPAEAERRYQQFKWDFVARWPKDCAEFEVVIDWEEWLLKQRANDNPFGLAEDPLGLKKMNEEKQ